MLKNYFKTSLRSLVRNKTTSFINIFGLAIGITVCFLILLYLQSELSFDGFHKNKDSIFRVAEYVSRPDGFRRLRAASGTPLGPLLKAEFPEVAAVVRFCRERALVSREDRRFYEDRFFYADPDVFKVFSFALTKGDPATALKEPFSVVLTPRMAVKYFGSADPIGQTLTLGNRATMTVTGIVNEAPANSHISFDFLASFETANRLWNGFSDHWDSGVWTYLMLAPSARPEALEEKLGGVVKKYRGAEAAGFVQYWLQPLTSIHLHSHLGGEIGANTEPLRLYLFAAIAAFILLIACINFVNLSTAQYTRRAEEVSVRKVLGAGRWQLIRQFMGESALLVAAALALAVVLAELSVPVFNDVVGTTLQINYSHNWLIPTGLLALGLLVTLLAGSYPALLLSKLDPVTVMQQSARSGRKGVALRRLLVVFQFVISVVLVIGTIAAYDQFRFMTSWNPGFDPERLLIVPADVDLLRDRLAAIKSELLRSHGITAVSAASNYPGDPQSYGLTIRPAGGSADMMMPTIWVEPDYARTLGVKMREGRDYDAARVADEGAAFILNAKAAAALGDQAAVGQHLLAYAGSPQEPTFSYQGPIVGHVEDFHFRDLRTRLQPVMLIVDTRRLEYLLIRVGAGELGAALASVKEILSRFVPDRPFESFFLDDYLRGLYRQEQGYATAFACACLLAVTVAVIGLFGLASCITEQRTREIGIRKALGASVMSIVLLLVREFVTLVAAANLIAWPIAYYLLARLLSRYPYRIDPGIGLFVLAGVVSILLALLTVGYRSIKSATSNPADALRYE